MTVQEKEPVVALQVQMDIQMVLLLLEEIVQAVAVLRLQAVFLRQALLALKVRLVKAAQLISIVVVVAAVAGMAAVVLTIMIQTLMDVMAVVVLVIYIPHQLLQIIHPVVCLIRLIISPMLKQLLVILHLLLQQEPTKQVIQGMVIYVLQLQRLTLGILQ